MGRDECNTRLRKSVPATQVVTAYPHQSGSRAQSLDGELKREPPLKYLRWQIPALLLAQRTLRNDPCIRKRINRRSDVLMTALAGDEEG